MRYLKKFEAVDHFVRNRKLITSMKTYAENALAYLLDDDYIIEVNLLPSTPDSQYVIKSKGDLMKIKLSKKTAEAFLSPVEPFTWSDVKDDYIPFLMDISSKYKMRNNMQGKEVYLQIVKPYANGNGELAKFAHGETIESLIGDTIDNYDLNFIEIMIELI